MFEKHKSTTPETTQQQSPQDKVKAPVNSGRAAIIGPGIHVNGEISGEENLVVEGRVDGKIRLDKNQVEIGQSGKVNANITAKVISIAGEVRGDLNGTEKVVISRTGNVHGNIVAPRMTLEDGAIFKGSIDMDPGEPLKSPVATPVSKTADQSQDKTKEAPKVIASEKASEKSAYSLSSS